MKNHPTTHWVTIAFAAVAALSLCLMPATAQTDDEVHGSYGSTVDRRIAQHDSWESAPQTKRAAQSPPKEWTPADAFGNESASEKPAASDGESAPIATEEWTPENAFGSRALSPAERELAGSSTSGGGAVFHGGYVYPPGTDTSKLKTPSTLAQKVSTATKTPAPKPESKVARSTPAPTTVARHPEQSEGSRSTRTASPPAKVTMPTTTESDTAPSPSTSTEPVEPPLPPVEELPDEVEFDDSSTSTPTGWQLVATMLSYGYLIAALVAAATGVMWVILALEKKPTKLASKLFFVALGTCIVSWGIAYTILSQIQL